jgi:hypothetical protein
VSGVFGLRSTALAAGSGSGTGPTALEAPLLDRREPFAGRPIPASRGVCSGANQEPGQAPRFLLSCPRGAGWLQRIGIARSGHQCTTILPRMPSDSWIVQR